LQQGLRALGAVDGPKAPPGVVEAVVSGAELKWREGQRVTAMPNPAKALPRSPLEANKLPGGGADRSELRRVLGAAQDVDRASSSRRVLVPRSLSTIMRTIL
jgi:hypothetical protein